MSLFAVLAVLLAAIGVYGVMAYSLEQRTREPAIRVALGARPAAVFAEVLFETRSVDPMVFGLVSALMLGIALLAAWVPARRAVSVDPMVSLRSE